MTPDQHKDAFAAFLKVSLNSIKAGIESDGPKPRDDVAGEFRVTLVIRHTSSDLATIVFGQDDEATLIVALKALGGSEGRRNYRAGPDGLREEDA